MRTGKLALTVGLTLIGAFAGADDLPRAQNSTATTLIPGITAADSTPRGCVDCHRPPSASSDDTRLSTRIINWSQAGASDEMMTAARAAWPSSRLTGQHPYGSEMLSLPNCTSCHPGRTPEQPTTCLFCHDETTERPLGPLVHTIHYSLNPEVSGTAPEFLTVYGGFCTLCHAHEETTGHMRLKRGAEALPE